MKADTSNLKMANDLEFTSDAELLKLSVAGNEAAFLVLYTRLKDPLFRYAFYMTSSRDTAEEVVQEVFVSLLKHAERYEPAQGDLPGFSFGIARNLVRRFRRRERSREDLPGDEALNKLVGNSEVQDLSVQAIRNQGVERIRAAIATLPDHYRQAIVLCDLCELSYEEAASRLQCAVGTIRSRLNRAHTLLAHKLKKSKKSQTEFPSAGAEECLI